MKAFGHFWKKDNLISKAGKTQVCETHFMKIYFVLRCPYVATHKIIQEFEAQSLLHWFQINWKTFESLSALNDRMAIFNSLTEKFGMPTSILADFILAIREENLTLPLDNEELFDLLDEFVDASETVVGEDFFTALTVYQGIEMAWYIFDQHYAHQNPERTTFMLYPDWQLPKSFGNKGFVPLAPFGYLPKRGKSQGKTFIVFLTSYDEDNLNSLEEALAIDGVRLDGLIDYLRGLSFLESYPMELVIMSQLVKDYGIETLHELCQTIARTRFHDIAQDYTFNKDGFALLHAYWKQTEEQELLWSLSPHCLQISNEFVSQLSGAIPEGAAIFNEWFIFDDLWAEANPHLATSLLYYAAQWDVLD